MNEISLRDYLDDSCNSEWNLGVVTNKGRDD